MNPSTRLEKEGRLLFFGWHERAAAVIVGGSVHESAAQSLRHFFKFNFGTHTIIGNAICCFFKLATDADPTDINFVAVGICDINSPDLPTSIQLEILDAGAFELSVTSDLACVSTDGVDLFIEELREHAECGQAGTILHNIIHDLGHFHRSPSDFLSDPDHLSEETNYPNSSYDAVSDFAVPEIPVASVAASPVSSEETQRSAHSNAQPAPLRPANVNDSFGPSNIDACIFSANGTIFIMGWADDRLAPITDICIEFDSGETRRLAGNQLMRLRRPDAEAVVEQVQSYHLGFCGLLIRTDNTAAGTGKPRTAKILAGDGSTAESVIAPRLMSDIDLRDLVLGYLASADYFGNKQVEAFTALDGHLGHAVVQHNREVVTSIIKGVACERFDVRGGPYKASIIVCLYGKSEFQFIQNALFSASINSHEYEYLYVSNSPELLEQMRNIALLSKQIYGLDVSLIMLPANAGFGAANNIAARYARSNRLIILNPDVFPKNSRWINAHNDLLTTTTKEQSTLFGSCLFYADGSLMHAGMYIDVDTGLSVANYELRQRPMLRVEHYGKGAPPGAEELLRSRPVTAVSGAFISVERQWFERLEGFAEDYIFGHYEDADLCLRSLDLGLRSWIHNLDLWHLEGKGSVRLPHHEGASIVNRWLFTQQWHDRAVPHLLGKIRPTTTVVAETL